MHSVAVEPREQSALLIGGQAGTSYLWWRPAAGWNANGRADDPMNRDGWVITDEPPRLAPSASAAHPDRLLPPSQQPIAVRTAIYHLKTAFGEPPLEPGGGPSVWLASCGEHVFVDVGCATAPPLEHHPPPPPPKPPRTTFDVEYLVLSASEEDGGGGYDDEAMRTARDEGRSGLAGIAAIAALLMAAAATLLDPVDRFGARALLRSTVASRMDQYRAVRSTAKDGDALESVRALTHDIEDEEEVI